MTDKEKYDALINTIIDQCIEMDLKKEESERHGDWDAALKYVHKYSALFQLLKSQGQEVLFMLYRRSYETGRYSQEDFKS